MHVRFKLGKSSVRGRNEEVIYTTNLAISLNASVPWAENTMLLLSFTFLFSCACFIPWSQHCTLDFLYSTTCCLWCTLWKKERSQRGSREGTAQLYIPLKGCLQLQCCDTHLQFRVKRATFSHLSLVHSSLCGYILISKKIRQPQPLKKHKIKQKPVSDVCEFCFSFLGTEIRRQLLPRSCFVPEAP